MLVHIEFGIAGSEFPAPIDSQSYLFELIAHGRDIGVGQFAWMYAFLARRVLSRQAERIPTHRMQHVESLGAAEPGEAIAHGVIAHMAHMDAAGRIGKHLQNVSLGPAALAFGAEDFTFRPNRLPALF